MNSWIKENYTKLVQIRRYLHQHPELGFEEHNTSDYLKNLLQQAGYSIQQTKPMKTGFYCEYGNGEGPVLALRCDLDALPIQDTKTVSYRSKVDGLLHGCGHDVHMAIITGLALWLQEENIKIDGTIRLIYQPAEEKAPGGALSMIEGGAIKNVNHLLGIHVLPSLETGKIGVRNGAMSASVSLLDFVLYGPGGHTSRPRETVDLIHATADLIALLYTKIDTVIEKHPQIALSFGKISGGNTFNVIPSAVKLRGTLRYVDTGIRDKLLAIVKTALNEIEAKTGSRTELSIPYSVPTVINNQELTNLVRISATVGIGESNVINLERASMGSDDFGYYSQQVPCSFIRIGSANGKVNDLHATNFDVDETCIKTALEVLTKTTVKYFTEFVKPA